MSSKSRTITKTANLKSPDSKNSGFHVIKSDTSLEKSVGSPKSNRLEETRRRTSLTSPTASSRAKQQATRASKPTISQKSVVVKVITAASVKAAQNTKPNSTANSTKNDNSSLPEPTRERKTQIKRPLDDDEDDIYAYYAKKKKRMDELRNASKAPVLTTLKSSTVTTKSTSSAKMTTKAATTSSTLLTPAAKRRATLEAIRAKSASKPSSLPSK